MLFLIPLLTLAAITAANQPNPNAPFKVYRIVPQTDLQFEFLSDLWKRATEYDLDFWQPPKRVGTAVDIMVPPTRAETVIDMFEKRRLQYQVTIQDVEKLIDAREHAPKVSGFGRLLRDDPGRNSAHYNFRSYGSYNEMRDYLKDISRLNRQFTKVITLGYTHEKRPIVALKIGNPIREKNKKTIWIDGGIHAREWAAPHTTLYFIQQLVSKYGSDPEITHYVDNLNFIITPVVNPDGYEYTRSARNPLVRLWRKNRSPPQCLVDRWGRQRCCQGVDLNRNFDFHWSETGSSSDPCSEVYHGRSAFSEPESKAVRDYVTSRDNRRNIEAFITLHTYSQIWIHPFGHKRVDYPNDVDELYRVGKKAAEQLRKLYGTRYTVGSGADTLYPAAGGSDDWAKDKAGIKFVYLLELRPDERQWDGFILSESQLIPTAKETWSGLRVVIDEVLKRNGIRPYRPSAPVTDSRGLESRRLVVKEKEKSSECFDQRYGCKKWVRNNPRLCTTVRYFMREQCASSCGYC